MKKAILFFLCFSLFALESNSQTITGSFMHDGLQRDYEVYIPANYTGSTAVPLILNFHGFTSNGATQFNTSNFKSVADTAGFIVVSPTGSTVSFLGVNVNHWNVGGFTSTSTVDDISFASALIDTIEANYNINLLRVYSTGFSNGGFFSHKLACELGNRIAAIASVSGTFTPEMQTLCAPSHPTPVMQIHGTNDGTVPYNGQAGNGGMESVDSVINYWVSHNNCNTIPTVTTMGSVEHFVYAGGTAGTNVELLKITNGTHTWPGNPGANQDINAGLEIWKFFSRYSNTAVGIPVELDLQRHVKIYPNPTNDFISIETDLNKKLSFKLYSFLGQEIMNGTLHNNVQRIDITDLPTGNYFLKIENTAFKILKTD